MHTHHYAHAHVHIHVYLLIFVRVCAQTCSFEPCATHLSPCVLIIFPKGYMGEMVDILFPTAGKETQVDEKCACHSGAKPLHRGHASQGLTHRLPSVSGKAGIPASSGKDFPWNWPSGLLGQSGIHPSFGVVFGWYSVGIRWYSPPPGSLAISRCANVKSMHLPTTPRTIVRKCDVHI